MHDLPLYCRKGTVLVAQIAGQRGIVRKIDKRPWIGGLTCSQRPRATPAPPLHEWPPIECDAKALSGVCRQRTVVPKNFNPPAHALTVRARARAHQGGRVHEYWLRARSLPACPVLASA